jgi:Nitrous oxide-stimulated promoter
MVGMYCESHHKAEKGLCQECIGLADYARMRLDKCTFGEKKPACAKCTIHCYSPSMRDKVSAVMKYAGPRMIAKHPILTLLHGI